MKLGFCVITRNKDAEGLDRLLSSVAGHVDGIYVTVADKDEPSPDVRLVCDRHRAKLSRFEWCDDFAAARNFNFSQSQDDWIAWGDTDDVVEGMEKAKGYLESLPGNVQFVVCTYNYAFTKAGKVSTKHPKERFIRNNGVCTWKGKLHESCVSAEQANGGKFDDIVWNHRTDGERFKESSARNVRIIEKELAEQIGSGKTDPRTVFNLGMAYASVAQLSGSPEDWERCVSAFHKYLGMGEWDQHAYMAWKYAGIAQMQVGRPDLAIRSFVEALLLQPGYSDAYAMLGSAYERLNDEGRAESWYKLALSAGDENAYASDVETSVLTPLYSLAAIHAKRGKFEDARKYLAALKEIVGEDEAADGMLAEMDRIDAFNKGALDVVSQMKAMPDAEAKAAFDALPQELKSHPNVVGFRRSKAWKKETGGKEVTIFGTSWEEWNPESAKTGIGGSEEAIIYLTRELRDLGWTVNVYGSHGTEAKEYDGIWYRPWWEWSPEEPTDVFVSWRDPGLFDLKINAKKRYCWLHDTNPKESFTEKRLAEIDKVIVLSDYHRSLYPNVPDAKIFRSSNGIIASQFTGEAPERVRGRAFYGSAPNRGLECLLRMWPEIRKKVPEAELYWAYGWETFDKMQRNNPLAAKFKEKILGLLAQPGVHAMGRIGHEEQARFMRTCSAWLYPTEFTEISCITAMKAQAAGCWPVCTDVAALKETVKWGTKFEVADIYTNAQAQERFVAHAAEYLSYPDGGEDVDRAEGVRTALESYSWSAVAKQWDAEFSA